MKIEELLKFQKVLNSKQKKEIDCCWYHEEKRCNNKLFALQFKPISYIICENHIKLYNFHNASKLSIQDIFTLKIL